MVYVEWSWACVYPWNCLLLIKSWSMCCYLREGIGVGIGIGEDGWPLLMAHLLIPLVCSPSMHLLYHIRPQLPIVHCRNPWLHMHGPSIMSPSHWDNIALNTHNKLWLLYYDIPLMCINFIQLGLDHISTWSHHWLNHLITLTFGVVSLSIIKPMALHTPSLLVIGISCNRWFNDARWWAYVGGLNE